MCPGLIRTPYHLRNMGQDKVDAFIPPCLMKRWAEPEEVAHPVVWLASNEASYVNAAAIMVDGGFPMLPML